MLHFRGVVSGIDAIGTTAFVTAGGKTYVQQLTAGDGFLASNHRVLTFGLGDAPRIDKLKVRWPTGKMEELPPPAVNQEVMVIEGQQRVELVPK